MGGFLTGGEPVPKKKSRNLSLYLNKIYMTTNLNVSTNGLPLNIDVITMFLTSYTSLVM